MKSTIILFTLNLLFLNASFAQNIGVGQQNPSEKLEVGGIIFSNEGGVKFPDSTLQTTAYLQNEFDTNLTSRKIAVLTMTGLNGNYDNSSLGIAKGVILVGEEGSHERAMTQGPGGMPIFGSAEGSQYNLTRSVDFFSPFFFSKSQSGSNNNTVNLYFIEMRDSGDFVYAKYLLQNVLVTKYEQDYSFHTNQSYKHVEKITLYYTKFAFTSYTDSGLSCFCWNYETNAGTNCGCN